MTDYISREAAIDLARKGRLVGNGNFKSVCKNIMSIPAADVRPVVRGEWKTAWLDHEAFGERPMVFYCSACNQITTFRTLYCPNCGAYMRKEVDGNV